MPSALQIATWVNITYGVVWAPQLSASVISAVRSGAA